MARPFKFYVNDLFATPRAWFSGLPENLAYNLLPPIPDIGHRMYKAAS